MQKRGFWIDRHERGYYQVHFDNCLVSIADTHLEAEQDVQQYEEQIKDIRTEEMSSGQLAVFLY
jgi:hypothetical protein